MKKLITALFITSITSLQAQKPLDKLGLEIGYKYRYNNNARIGLSYKLNKGSSYASFSPIGLPSWKNISLAYLTDFKNEHYAMVGIHTTALFFEIGVNASTKKDIEPTLGLNIANYGRINFGYNIAFKQDNNFTFGASFALGLKKDSKYHIE